MFEIKMRINHDCPYSNIADLFEFPLYEFCSELYDLLIVPKRLDKEEIEQLKKFIWDVNSLEIFYPGPNSDTTYVYFSCMCKADYAIVPRIKQHGGIVEYPIRYEKNFEFYNVISLNEKTQASLIKFVQSIPELELLSINDLGREGLFKSQFISMHQMFKSLTNRQVEVIVKAYQEGYYEIPRDVTTTKLAKKFGVSRPATEKSLRKAENRIIDSVIPYLLVHQVVHKEN